jgi:septal ring factor EnvC (AmiA/AmiB activator)
MNPFSLKVLKDSLRKEKEELQYWEHINNSTKADIASLRQSNRNIPNCSKRIAQLEETILSIEKQLENVTVN